MRKQLALERASVVSAAAKDGDLIVIASAEPKYDPKVATASYHCTQCKTVFASLANFQPFCITCGMDAVDPVSEQQEVTLPPTDETMCVSTCDSCDANTMIPVHHAKALSGLMHCAACGAQITYAMDGEEPTLLDAADEDDLHQIEATAEKAEKADTSLPTDPPEVIDQANDDDVIEMVEASDDSLDDAGQQSPLDDAMSEDDVATNSDPAAGATDLQVAAIAGAKDGDIQLCKLGDATMAFVGETHVATLHKSDMSPEVAALDLASLQDAVIHSTEREGLRATLAALGFQLAKVKFSVKKTVKAALETQLKSERSAIEQASAKMQERFEQSLKLAAMAIARNAAPKTYVNPIRDSLVETLASAGVQSPKHVVDTALATSLDSYNRNLIQYATELFSKSDEVRNELAATIGNVGIYQETSSEQDGTVLPFRPASSGEKPGKTSATAAVNTVRASAVASVRGTFGRAAL